MNRTEYLLTCLTEDCAEVSQRVAKALRFGLDEIELGQKLTNAERISQSLTDLYATVAMLNADDIVQHKFDIEGFEAKMEKIVTCMRYANKCGTLQL